MARLDLDREMLDYLVIGGSFYGGGGGGSMAAGRDVGRLALELGRPHLVDLDDVPGDALLLTVSAVGAPAGTGAHASPGDYVKAAELFQRETGKTVSGFIANECGGLATVNGWVQSAATGLPIVDAPCNGRAHPTGAMGSMGLNRLEGYVSEQVAVGGSRSDGSHFEIFIRGSVESASGLVRRAASQAGGLVAVARNPVTASYARANAAPGAIRRCLEVGRAIMAGRSESGLAAAEAAARASGGRIACTGKVTRKRMETAQGFDVGSVLVGGGIGGAGGRAEGGAGRDTAVELVFCNEYLTMEEVGSANRLATFPDLLATLDLSTGLPVTSAELGEEQNVAVVVVPRGNLILGAGMRDRDLYVEVERIAGKEIVKYVF